jgi:hypothetical protein
MELEHAESRFTLGPTRSKNQLIRLASIAGEVPIAAYFEATSGSLENSEA